MKLLYFNSSSELALNESSLSLPEAGTNPDGAFVFSIEDNEYAAIRIQHFPSGLISCNLRESWKHISADEWRAAAKGAELLFWDSRMKFCPTCGHKLNKAAGISKKCTGCGYEAFPQLSPAILVLVKRGEEALLVHAKNFSRPFFGLVAGFVETGESLEECVRREVMEETGITISDIRYVASQSWPFPSQLMIGFTAEYISGDIVFADGELSDGGFFDRDSLPELPTAPSLARELVERWRHHLL